VTAPIWSRDDDDTLLAAGDEHNDAVKDNR
jgi:hypothetical protein